MEVLDWSVQYQDIGSDGFKAELIWLASLYGLQGHSSVQGFTFESSEWEAFAAEFSPNYQSDWVLDLPEFTLAQTTDYALAQLVAIKSVRENLTLSIPIEGDLNERVHKVIWCSNFGRNRITAPDAVAAFQTDLQSALSNDDRAKVYLALVLLRQNAADPIDILEQAIEPHTYHEILCVLAGMKLKEMQS